MPWRLLHWWIFAPPVTKKIPIIRHIFGVGKVKNRLIGDFWEFYPRAQQTASKNIEKVYISA
jgi:hypothetical protein